ncbi:MAG: nuclear transport factor 2 family protein [Lachnospiraceae bacterium]|nr:nuclear transport factor 2 family protein [Lachnospiraceae bacterium]
MDDKYTNRTVEEVLEHHIKYLGEGNLEETLKDYTDESYLINPNGVVCGLDELRAFFDDSIRNCLPPDTIQKFVCKRVHGDLAYIVWNAESRFYSVPFGTDSFVIRNGHIVMQTFAGIMKEVEKS